MVRLGLYTHALPGPEGIGVFVGEHVIGTDGPACAATPTAFIRESTLDAGGFGLVCRSCLRRLVAAAGEEPPR